jgi:hypothetical protein
MLKEPNIDTSKIIMKTIHKPEYTIYGELELDFVFSKSLIINTNNEILFIDETSMIDTDIYKYLVNNVKGKVIFFGDTRQLPPIGENLSPVRYIEQEKLIC